VVEVFSDWSLYLYVERVLVLPILPILMVLQTILARATTPSWSGLVL
jgi:hypothetical protein